MTMIIGQTSLKLVCPGAEFSSEHIVLSRPNGEMVISRTLEESDKIYVHCGLKAGGILEENEFVEFCFPNEADSGMKIDVLVSNFEHLAK